MPGCPIGYVTATKMMKLLLLLLIGVGAEAGPVLGLNDNLHEAMVKARLKLAAEAKAHGDKRGRSLESGICDDPVVYNTAVDLYGDALVQCLCNNNRPSPQCRRKARRLEPGPPATQDLGKSRKVTWKS